LPAKPGSTPCTPIVVHAQQRPTWLPGLDPPPYLGTSAAHCALSNSRPELKNFCLLFMFCLILLCFSKFSLAGDFGFDPLGLGEDPESGM
jgi:light-harvesting complex I chlorophyll a/b binding protein 5